MTKLKSKDFSVSRLRLSTKLICALVSVSIVLSSTARAASDKNAQAILDKEDFAASEGWFVVNAKDAKVSLDSLLKSSRSAPMDGSSSNTTSDIESTVPADQRVYTSPKSSKQNQWLRTNTKFSDGTVSFDFLIPEKGKAEVLLLGSYGIALYDSHEQKGIDLNTMGALQKSWGKWEWSEYNRYDDSRSSGGRAPLVNAAQAPGQWQRFSARYRGPRFDNALNRVEPGIIFEIYINDQLVHKNLLLGAPTQNAINFWEESTGPLVFEGRLGAVAIKNVHAERANFDGASIPEKTGGDSNIASLKDQVKVGQDTFLGKGCAECHSLKPNDTAVKTGPNLYGLFQNEAKAIEVEDAEKHRFPVKANFTYLETSIRDPLAHLAIRSQGEQKGATYMPIMPRYSKEIVSDADIAAIYSYLLTKNAHKHRGPTTVLLGADGAAQYDPLKDSQEFLVIDRVRVQRGPMEGLSARAAHVGNPNGIHYSFDPRNFSLTKLWQGGFLQASGELNNRGGNGYAMGYSHIEIALDEAGPLLQFLNNKGEPIDFSFKEPLMGDKAAFERALQSGKTQRQLISEQDARFRGYTLNSKKPWQPPVFHLDIGSNSLHARVDFAGDGKFILTLSGLIDQAQTLKLNRAIISDIQVSSGELAGNKWTLPQGEQTHQLVGHISKIAPSSWRPEISAYAMQGQALQSDRADIKAPAGYQARDIYPPLDNAGRKQLFEALGIAQAENGDTVLSTRTAGVWHVRDQAWYQFADGIFDSLGLVIDDAAGLDLVVGSKLELTRLKDINNDGIADQYLTLFDAHSHADYHSYLHGPTKDAKGNYIFTINLGTSGLYKGHEAGMMSTHGGYPGWAVKVAPSGEYELFANGLRSPASLGTDPQGGLWYADNQGDFVSTSKLFRLEADGFYGHPASLVDLAGMKPSSTEIKWDVVKDSRAKAAVLLPQNRLANSPGNPVWDTTQGAFGPFKGQLIFGDQTQSNLVRVTTERVKGIEQGVAMPFISGLASGVMRPVFVDNQELWLGQTGRGWQAKGGKVAALQKISWNTKSEPEELLDVSATENGFLLSFTSDIRSSVSSADFAIESWVYRDAPEYGSDELGLRAERVAAVEVIDSRTIKLVLADLNQPAVHPMQTARVYEINVARNVFQSNSEAQPAMQAYYTLYSFK